MLMAILCLNSHAQNDSLFKAQTLCNEKKFSEAINIIDKVILNPETNKDPASWHIRAYAYLQSYKLNGSGNTSKVSLLDTALHSTLISLQYDSKLEYKENNLAFLKNGAASYYKLCIILLQDSLNPINSEKFYFKYKKYTTIVNPTFDLKEKDIEYYNAAGGLFGDLYSKNNFNQKYGDFAKTALLKVLEIDSKNISANINLGILYYNQGATLMRELDYDIQIDQLEVVQENAKKLFKQSLPFMMKVYELQPKDARAIEGIAGIYSALLDEEKANEFKQKKEALNKK
jgi:tetratricopeptide (TPR) repeat protein